MVVYLGGGAEGLRQWMSHCSFSKIKHNRHLISLELVCFRHSYFLDIHVHKKKY